MPVKALSIFAVSVALCACSGSTGGTDGGSTGAGGSSGASSSGGSSSSSGGSSTAGGSSSSGGSSMSGGSSGGSSSGSLPYVGSVLFQEVFTDAEVAWDVFASFYPANTPYVSVPPTTLSPAAFCGNNALVGDCCYLPAPLPDAGFTSNSEFVSAGTLTLLDGTTTFGSGTPPDYENSIAFVDGGHWTGGDTLEVQASGGVVDAFTAQINAPQDIVGVGSAAFLADGGTAVIVRSQALSFSWTAVSSSAQLVLGLYDNDGANVICLPPDTGSYVLPSSLLLNFPAGAQGGVQIERIALVPGDSANSQITIAATTADTGNVVFQ